MLMLLMTITACQKDQEIFIPDQAYIINNNLLLSDLVGSPSSYIVDIDNKHEIILDNITISLPKEGIFDKAGNNISGEINIEYKDYTHTKGNLIYAPSTISTDYLIDTEHLIYLRLTKDDVPITLNQPLTIYIRSDHKTDGLGAYLLGGDESQSKWYNSELLSSSLIYENEIDTSGNTTNSYGRYKLILQNHSGWLMIGKPIVKLTNTDSQLYVNAANCNDHNSLAYFVANEENMVLKLDYDAVTRQFFTKNSIENKTIEGKIILINQYSDRQFNFGTTNAVLGKDMSVKLTTQPSTLKEIKAALAKL